MQYSKEPSWPKQFFFFSQQLRSLRATVFPGGFVLSHGFLRKPFNGVFPEESENGPGWRARCVYGRTIKAIGDYVHPVGALQARSAVASRAFEVDWPRKMISESGFLSRFVLFDDWPP